MIAIQHLDCTKPLKYRTVTIELTPEQVEKLQVRITGMKWDKDAKCNMPCNDEQMEVMSLQSEDPRA
jgi:hypothetical protein